MWCVSLPRRRSCWVLTLCSYCFMVSRYCSLWRFGTGLGGACIPGRWDQCFSAVLAYLWPAWCTRWSMWWLWTVLLVVVFDRCHLFGGCESVSLWYPEQWLINAIKYNNEALVYHGNITGLNLVTCQQQPQFPGWVTPTPTGYYAWLSDGSVRICASYKDTSLLKVKFSNCPRDFILI